MKKDFYLFTEMKDVIITKHPDVRDILEKYEKEN